MGSKVADAGRREAGSQRRTARPTLCTIVVRLLRIQRLTVLTERRSTPTTTLQGVLAVAADVGLFAVMQALIIPDRLKTGPQIEGKTAKNPRNPAKYGLIPRFLIDQAAIP
jgi:hypothetical protein